MAKRFRIRSVRPDVRTRIMQHMAAAAVTTILAGSIYAATDLWVGNTSANWNDLNWTGGNNPPVEFDSLEFGVAGTSGTILNNDYPVGTYFTGLTFDNGASPYEFNGNQINLSGPITNNSTVTQVINFDIGLNGQQTVQTTAGGGDVRLNGVLSGNGGVTKANSGSGAAGVLYLSNANNSYTGETIFGPGITNVASLSDYGVNSSIGARADSDENGTPTGVGLHFTGGTLQYTGSTAQSTNRNIRVLIGNGATLDASGSNPDATLSFTHSGPNLNLFDTPGARTITLTGTNVGRNSFSIQLTNQGGSQTSLAKTGPGTWYITNSDNAHTGETIFAGGILNVASVSDYGVSSSIGARAASEENTSLTGVSLHFQGGTLQYTGTTPQSTNRNIRVLNGNGATFDASGATPDATLSFTHTGANLNLFDNPGVRTLTLTGTNTGENRFSVQLTNQSGNPTNLLKNGTGTWVLNGPDDNTATGTTAIEGGTLVLGKSNAVAVNGNLIIGDGVDNDVVVIGGTGGNQILDSLVVGFGGTAGTTGILRLNNKSETVGGLSSQNGAGVVENGADTAGVGTLNLNVTGAQTYAGLIRDGAHGLLVVNKTGAGSMTLEGTTSHTGATNVTAGTLTVTGTLGASSSLNITNATVDGSGTIAGPINVGSAAVLSASGTMSGIVTLSNGGTLAGTGLVTGTVNANSGSRISPGDASAPGTLTIGTLNLNTGAMIDLEFGTSNDLINITTPGGLALNGGAVNLFGAGGTTPLSANGIYTLLDYTGTFTGSLANLSIANSQVGKFYSLSNDSANTLIQLTVGDATLTEWKGVQSGSWSTPANWTAGVPNAPGAVAKFGMIPTAPTTVSVSGPKTVGGILFDNTNGYTIAGGAADTITLDNGVAAASITVNSGNHTIAAPVVLATSANISTAAGSALQITGTISGGKPFITSGAGTTILTGTNSFSTTTVNGGTLQVGDGGTTGTLGTGDINLASGTGLVFFRSDDLTVANNIAGASGVVTKMGAGVLTLSGTNTFGIVGGGGLNLNEGTVKLASPAALGTGVALNFNGGNLDLNGNSASVSSLVGATGNITSSGAGTDLATLTIDQAANATFGGNILNGATRRIAVTKQGTGLLTLSGNNTFTGDFRILNGTVQANGDGTNLPIVSNVILGDGSNPVRLTAGGAAQQFGPSTVVTFNNGGKDAKLELRGSNQTLAGLDSTADPSVSLAIIQNDENSSPGYSGPAGPAVLTLNTTTNHSFAGLIRNLDGGGLTIVKEGAATQEIRNALIGIDSFNSAVVNQGKLVFNFFPFGNGTGTLAAGTTLIANGEGNLAFDGTWSLPANLGGISGDGTISKQGNGTVTLLGANTFTKEFVLNSGTLEIGNDQALGAPTANIVLNGGNIRAANAGREVPNPVIVNNSFTLGRLTNLNGGLTLMADATITADNPDGAANNPSALSAISGNFRVSFAEGPATIGNGALVINGVNTNTGGTTVSSGRVNVNANGALANADLVVNGGELNLNNATQTVQGLSGVGGTVNLGFGHVFTVEQTASSSFSGNLGGGGTFVKQGAGTLSLGGTNSNFSGPVSVLAGALLVSGNLNGNVAVSGNTATLGGTGFTGPVSVTSGGTINPGGPTPGTLTVGGDLSFTSGTTLRLELENPNAGGGYDQLATFGNVDLGEATLSLGGGYLTYSSTPTDVFFLMLNSGPNLVTGTFSGLAEGGIIYSVSGQAFQITYMADSDLNSFTGGNDIALMAVPEPGSATFLAVGLTLACFRRRRATAVTTI